VNATNQKPEELKEMEVSSESDSSSKPVGVENCVIKPVKLNPSIRRLKYQHKKANSHLLNNRMRLNIKQAKLMGMLAAHKLSKDNFKYILKTVKCTKYVEKLSQIINPKIREDGELESESDQFNLSQEFRKILDEYKQIKQEDRHLVSFDF
jgi:hypothetical protein